MRVWRVTKPNRLSPNGLARITMAQDIYNEHTDYVEYEVEGDPSTIIAAWADYWNSPIEPDDPDDPITPTKIAEVSYSGISSELKINGSYKKFTVEFYDSTDNTELPFQQGEWTFIIDGNDATDLLDIKYPDMDDRLNDNQIYVKFTGGDEYIGKVLMVKYRSDTGMGAEFVASGYVEMAVVGL